MSKLSNEKVPMIILCLSAITCLLSAGAWWNTVQLRQFDDDLMEAAMPPELEDMLAEAQTSDRPSQELNELVNEYVKEWVEEMGSEGRERLKEALGEFDKTTGENPSKSQLRSIADESSDPELKKLIDEILRELEDPTTPKE